RRTNSMMTQFGCGAVLARPTGGDAATPSGAGQFLTVQEVGVEASVQLVPLKGQSQYPDDVAPGDKELKGSGSTGRLDSYYFNSFMFGDVLTVADTTATQVSVDELQAIPASSTYTVSGTKTTAVNDLGVRYAVSNQPLENIGGASLTAAGQYKVAIASGTITYTVYSGDASALVLISYEYTATADSLLMINHPMGFGPTNELFLQYQYKGTIDNSGKNLLHLFNVRFSNW